MLPEQKNWSSQVQQHKTFSVASLFFFFLLYMTMMVTSFFVYFCYFFQLDIKVFMGEWFTKVLHLPVLFSIRKGILLRYLVVRQCREQWIYAFPQKCTTNITSLNCTVSPCVMFNHDSPWPFAILDLYDYSSSLSYLFFHPFVQTCLLICHSCPFKTLSQRDLLFIKFVIKFCTSAEILKYWNCFICKLQTQMMKYGESNSQNVAIKIIKT